MKAAHVRLATENGRRVARISKAKRLGAQDATESARLRRALAAIRIEAEKAEAIARKAEAILELAYSVAGGEDRITARALAREAVIECRMAHHFHHLVRYCEMAEEGTLCA